MTELCINAVYDNSTYITVSADVNLLDGEGESTTVRASLENRNGTENITVSYSVADGEEFVTLTDNKDGTATVTSKKEGMAKILCTASDSAQEALYILSRYVDYPDVEVVHDEVDMSAHKFEGNHLNSYYDETEKAYKFIRDNKVIKTDDGNGNVTYHTDGFMRISSHGDVDTSVYKYLLLTVKCEYSIPLQIRYYTPETNWKTISQGKPTLDPTGEKYVTYAIDMDKGTAKACLFTNKASGGELVWKVSDSSCVFINQMDNTIAEITPVTNGTITVTACDSKNEENCDSFSMTISGQREKQMVYDLRVLFWGASVTKHGPYAALEWTGNWGMAATSEDKDYVHRLVARLEETFYPSKVNFEIVATGSRFDAAVSSDTNPNTNYSSDSAFTDLERAVKRLQPNIVMADNTGNLRSGASHDCIVNAYTQIYDMVYKNVPQAIVCSGYCHLGHRGFIEKAMEALGEHYKDSGKIFLLNHYRIAEDPTNLAPEWLDKTPPQPGVAAHWGDKGMDEVSKTQFNLIESYIRTNIEPVYVYIPEKIQISGVSEIKTEGGKVTLTAVSFPSDTTNDVIWSVDDERVAAVNENGVVTAVNNGKVTVTAVSKYNEEVFDTFTITVTGQPKAFSVTYDANTTDTVTGLPEKTDFAKGITALSQKRPLRDCYTFVGWSTSSDSEECVTSVDVTADTTVYAVWKKTEGFEFEGEYDEYFGYTYGFNISGGFHSEVHDGKLSCICTEGEKVRIVSPRLDIENKGFMVFKLESAFFDSTSSIVLTVKDESSSKTFVYPYNTIEEVSYVSDTSALGEKITGFEIYIDAAPEDGTMFPVSLDYVRFEELCSIDAENGDCSVCVSDIVISNMSSDNAAETALKNTKGASIIITDKNGFDTTVKNASENTKLYISCNGASASTASVAVKDFIDGKYLPAVTKVYCSKDGVIGEDELVSGVITAYDKSSMRIKEPVGIRVMASVLDGFCANPQVEEYGFIVTNAQFLDNGTVRELVYDAQLIEKGRIIAGKAYSKNETVHKIYELSDGLEYYTAVLTNIPKDKFSLMTPIVFRPYVKLSDGRYVYGVKTVRSACDVAKDIMDVGTADKAVSAAASEILDICGVEYSEENYIDVGPLN